jgi:hypothetical protein
LIFDDWNTKSNQIRKDGGEKKMKRKTTLTLTMVLLTVLSVSSIAATAQAWWPTKNKPEYVGYSLEVTNYEGSLTYIDASAAPSLIIFEGVVGETVDCTITIDDTVYTYPDDFNYSHSYHLEFNAQTGEGFTRSESTLTFKGYGHPTITTWAVSKVSGLHIYPNGSYVAPEEVNYEGTFEISGTKQFSNFEGFGLSEAYFLPPDCTLNYIKQVGYIKGWPF